MLESNCHGDNAFVTLTYDDENIPGGNNYATLQRSDLTNFLKRLRDAIKPARIRYFGVGEYGDETDRPHYHLAIFGFPTCSRGGTSRTERRKACCEPCDLIQRTWGLGLIHVGTLAIESAQYIAGYVTKKMTMRDDPRLYGRDPEFAAMSLRPGIGANFVPEIASTLMQFNLDTTQADVPVSLRHGSRSLPLGRYMRRKIRENIGKEAKAPENIKAKIEMLSLLQAAKTDPQAITLKQQIVKENLGKVLRLEALERFRKKRKPL